MDYKNILEGARSYFGRLPSPSQSIVAANSTTPTTPAGTVLPILPLVNNNNNNNTTTSHIQQENSVIRTKYEEGLGATLSQMYGTGVSSLRSTPAPVLSPKINTNNSNCLKATVPNNLQHLTLRGGGSAVPAVGLVGSSTPLVSAVGQTKNNNSNTSGSAGGGTGQPNMVVRRESPLDLSVKTVRQSADSSTSLTPTELTTGNSVSSGSATAPPSNNNRSLSGSGASTPNNTNNTAANTAINHVSSVIAAVVNSTTGRGEREFEAHAKSLPHSNLSRLSMLTPQQQHQQQQNAASQARVEGPAAPQSQPHPGFTTPNHHLFGHYPAQVPGATIPPQGGVGKAYQQYLAQSATSPGGNVRSSSSSSVAVPTSKGQANSSTPTPAPHQQRPSSVIPPYNPPTPSFGVYHQQSTGPIHSAFHHSHSPYPPYQHPLQQTQHQQHTQQLHHPNPAAYYHNPYVPNNPPTSNSNSTNLNGINNSNDPYYRNSASVNQAHQPSTGSGAPGLQQYQQPSATKEAHQQAQHYGLQPPTTVSSYHHYPQYVPQHLVQNTSHLSSHSNSSPITNNTNSGNHQSQPPQSMAAHPQPQQLPAHQFHPSYHNSNLPQPRYGGQPPQQRFPTPSHLPPSPYSPYHQPQVPPRGVATAVAPQQSLPNTNYSPHYPSHLAGPTQPPPTTQSPKQKKTAAVAAAALPKAGQNENSNSSSTNSGTTSTSTSHHRNSSGANKPGGSRKNLLNLLRNSLETRIHEKQEKEKFQFNTQTWSFHGRKITLPPPPGGSKNGELHGPTPNGPIGGSGSILTGLSNHNNNSSSTTVAIGQNGTSLPNMFPDIFGINQRNSNSSFDDESRAMTFHGSQELSPNGADGSHLNRIRTKAEKKQLFPNLLSQIEQENSNKNQQQQNSSLMPEISSRYSKSGQPKSVFDFEDEEDEGKIRLNRSNSIGSSHAKTPPTATPARKSGSKKFTSKLTKAKDYFNSSGLTSNAIDTINAVIASASAAHQQQASTSLGSITTNSIMSHASSSTGIDSKTALMNSFSAEPLDSFWAACDSFVDDLAKNPTTIKSKRGGLWTKLKSKNIKDKENANEGKSTVRRPSNKRVRRNSSEEDEDFEIDAKSDEGDEDEEEDEDEENSNDDDSHSTNSSEDFLSARQNQKKSKSKRQRDEEDDDDEDSIHSAKKTRSGGKGNSIAGSKRKNSIQNSSPAKKGKKSKNNNASISSSTNNKKSKRDSRGIKVGNHTLRERRATSATTSAQLNLIGKGSVSDLDEDATSRSSIGSASDDDDDSNVSYSISDVDNSDSDASTNSDDSNSDSDDSSDDDSDDNGNSDASSSAVGKRKKTSKVKSSPTSKRKGSTKAGGKKTKKNSKERRLRNRKTGRKRLSLRSGDSKRKNEKKNAVRKLRPKRNCAKDKIKEVSVESGEDGIGSSGEEWIMRGELTKRKSRVIFGDGSDFKRPGWEEELIDFKKKLRMPAKLIRVSKPSSLIDIKDESAAINTTDKSAKENKSPNKLSSVSDEPLAKSKGRVSKGAAKEKEALPVKGKGTKNEKKSDAESSMDEPAIGKAVEKMNAATKKNASLSGKQLGKTSKEVASTSDDVGKNSESAAPIKSGKKSKASSLTTPSKTPKKDSVKGTPSKESAKIIKGQKNKDEKSTVSKDSTIPAPRERIEKQPQLLPTPGPAGLKFNKKMSRKAVFGVDSEPAANSAPPSTSTSTPSPAPSTSTPATVRKVLRRNKFKSGFDYIRKKKKPTPTPDGSVAPPPPKRAKMSQEKNLTEEDIQLELRGWVLNKGLGETALHRAARLGYADVAAYSLEHVICSPNCKDNAGYTPLHNSCIKGNLEVAKVLLHYGANPSQAAPGGIRPLHEACENGHVELVRLLISYGADPALATYAGQTPVELAEHHEPVKNLLVRHIKDAQGREEKLWRFRGSGIWSEDPFDNGYDTTEGPLLPIETDYKDGLEFESSEAPLPPLYLLKGDTPYVLIQDLVNYVGVSRDKLLRNHPTAELVELNSNDFLEEAHCCHLLGEKFNLNSSSDLLSLIKYDDRVKKMLNIDSYIVK